VIFLVFLLFVTSLRPFSGVFVVAHVGFDFFLFVVWWVPSCVIVLRGFWGCSCCPWFSVLVLSVMFLHVVVVVCHSLLSLFLPLVSYGVVALFYVVDDVHGVFFLMLLCALWFYPSGIRMRSAFSGYRRGRGYLRSTRYFIWL
jgi:hypothetical protein